MLEFPPSNEMGHQKTIQYETGCGSFEPNCQAQLISLEDAVLIPQVKVSDFNILSEVESQKGCEKTESRDLKKLFRNLSEFLRGRDWISSSY